jgi:organic hydroperoxide reductase OsmC/OhrA
MPTSHAFAATLEWTGARAGVTSNYESYSREYAVAMEGKPTLVGSSAPVFRGDGGLHNPEDLLLAAVVACHLLSYLALCARRGIEVVSYRDSCTATMEVRDGVLRFVEATLRPVVEIASGDVALAMELHKRAHAECFIAASVNFPIACQAQIVKLGPPNP